MSEESERAIEQIDGGELEAEAHSLVETFNEAKASHSPRLEWFAMSAHRHSGMQLFVFQSPEYVDRKGLAALRERGRRIQYIEAYEFDGEVLVQFEICVEGGR